MLLFYCLSSFFYIEVFENFQDVFFMVKYDKNNEQVDFVLSPSSKKVFGYSNDEIKSLSFNDLFLLNEEREMFLQMIKGEEKVQNYPLTLKNKNGNNIHISKTY